MFGVEFFKLAYMFLVNWGAACFHETQQHFRSGLFTGSQLHGSENEYHKRL